MNELRRRIDILEIPVQAPEPRDLVPPGNDRQWTRMLDQLAEHPQVIAMRRAYAEQAARPPYEETAAFRGMVEAIRSLLADVPPDTLTALRAARARFADVDQALTSAESEVHRISAAQPTEIGKLDKWSMDMAVAQRKYETLVKVHQQAADHLVAARASVLAALVRVAGQRAQVLHGATEEAQAAARRAQAAVAAAHQAETETNALLARIRDQGAADAHVDRVLKEV